MLAPHAPGFHVPTGHGHSCRSESQADVGALEAGGGGAGHLGSDQGPGWVGRMQKPEGRMMASGRNQQEVSLLLLSSVLLSIF